MAALMTSVIDNPGKVSEYIFTCRNMGIEILPPDINYGETAFSVDHGAIRYALSAIKSVGKSVIDDIVKERTEGGLFTSIKDFITRMSSREINKRVLENFIKSGAFDCFEGNRRQKILAYPLILENAVQEKKNTMAGQISLFDLVSEEDKKAYEIQMPDVEEYDQETLLNFEKEVLGIYISGHPLEKFRPLMEKNVTAWTSDFQPDEETGFPKVQDGAKAIVGGMITEKKVKYTKNNKVMAFLTLEDLVGTIEIVVFPRDYEKNQRLLEVDSKVLIQGRISAEDDRASKLICEKVRAFDEVPKEVWIQFETSEDYLHGSQDLMKRLGEIPGRNAVVIFLKDLKAMKRLPASMNVQADEKSLQTLQEFYGTQNVKVVERVLKNF